jgi:hypothetical protein
VLLDRAVPESKKRAQRMSRMSAPGTWYASPAFSAHFGQKSPDAAFCWGKMFSIADLLRKAEHAPTAPGAYILLIRLAVPVEVALPGKPKATLGVYSQL